MGDVPLPCRLSLRGRIVALATLAVTVVLAVGGWLLGAALHHALVDDLGQAAALRARDLAALAAQDMLPRPIPVGDADEALVQVVAGGEVTAASANAAGLSPLDLPPPPAGGTTVADVAALPVTDEEDKGGFVVAATSVAAAGGTITVYVASSLEDVTETLAEATRLALLALPVLVGVLAVGMWVVTGRTLAPVDAIRAEADAITGTDLHRRVPEPGRDDEIGRLARTLNRMLARLEQAAERQRRFVADAAHELRTPVASVRTTLETARSSPREIDWDEVSADVLADTTRMQQLTERLLLLARVGAGLVDARMQPVDLDDVVARAAGRHGDVDVEVDLSRVEPVQVAGDAVLLEQVVRNLLDNATAYATGCVSVALRRDGRGRAVLTVDDDGPGIPAEHRQAVFERFVRLDPARNRRHGGAGLGLAIVADIVTAHDGDVHADDSPLGGARVAVSLPALEH